MKSLFVETETRFADTLITGEDLAEILELDRQTINRLAREGVLKRYPQGRKKLYRLGESIRTYYHQKIKTNKKPSEILALERSKLVALQIAEKEKELVSAAEVETRWIEELTTIRQILLSIPARVGEKLPHLTQADIQEVDRQIRNALNNAPRS